MYDTRPVFSMNRMNRNICRKHGIEMFFKGANNIRELLVHPKGNDNILKKSGLFTDIIVAGWTVKMST